LGINHPAQPDLYAQFAQNCANNWARNLKKYCRYYLIGNEIDFDFTPEQYVPCFEQVRDAIKAVQPDARVIVGHWNSDGNLRSTVQLLGPGNYDGVTVHTGSSVPTSTLNMLDEEGAPPHVGVYISEWGWVAGTNSQCGQRDARLLQRDRAVERITRSTGLLRLLVPVPLLAGVHVQPRIVAH